jgi:hypothetical protein
MHALIRSARANCTVFTPFYSRDGLSLVDTALRRAVPLTVWTRLSLRDWANGAADPEALCTLLVKLENSQRPPQLFTNKKLHAKAYFADTSSALVGSANLSKGGFDTNVELMVQLDGEDAATALSVLTLASSLRAVPVTTDDLAKWVSRHKKLIKRARANLKKGLRDLDVAQQDTDAAIGERPLLEPTRPILEEFVQWLVRNPGLPGAAQVATHHSEKKIRRQQGHVKQCFSGVFRFLQEHPAWIQPLTAIAGTPDGLRALGASLLTDWSSHLQAHANAHSDFYSYATLRRILTQTCGGLHEGGGGGDATLKRVFPLVARFISERGNRFNTEP